MNINDAGTVGSISRNVFFQALEKSDTYPSSVEARCSSMVLWVVGSIVHSGPIDLFLVQASAPRLV